MKAISLWQPWASLIAAGVKPFETRHWAPSKDLIGQRIAIHAARNRGAADLCEEIMYGQHHAGGFELSDALTASWGDTPDGETEIDDRLMGIFGKAVMPAGCIVCTAKLDAAFMLPSTEVKLDPWGDYTPGRYAWRLTEVQALKPPVLMTGRQGWWELRQGWMTEEAA